MNISGAGFPSGIRRCTAVQPSTVTGDVDVGAALMNGDVTDV